MYPTWVASICISICPTPCADPTLTINNLRLVMASVKNWYGLYVPNAVCNEIWASTAYQTGEEKKEALLLYYLHTMPMASWQDVAGALHYKKEETALQAVKAFLKLTLAGQLILQGTYISAVCYCISVHEMYHIIMCTCSCTSVDWTEVGMGCECGV